jgi:hypothetical protein
VFGGQRYAVVDKPLFFLNNHANQYYQLQPVDVILLCMRWIPDRRFAGYAIISIAFGK